jgi:hypothetical protein
LIFKIYQFAGNNAVQMSFSPEPQPTERNRMERNRQANGSDEMSVKLPDAGALMEAQRAATENAARMTNAACHYAMSVNKSWLELWDAHLDQYLELPKRFAHAQTDFLQQAFGHYQESMQKLGSVATKATQDVQSAVRETQGAAERVANELQSDARESGGGNRPKEAQKHSGEQHREGSYQPGGH